MQREGVEGLKTLVPGRVRGREWYAGIEPTALKTGMARPGAAEHSQRYKQTLDLVMMTITSDPDRR